MVILEELKKHEKKRAKGVKVTRKVVMYILIVLGIIVLFIPSLIFATLMTQYFPDQTLRIDVSDTRTTENKTQHSELSLGTNYSALTYNVGYNAYNQNMHFFMDGDSQWICGQGKSESKTSTMNSLYGVDRVLSANHDTDPDKRKDAWDDCPTNELRGVDIYKSQFNDDGSWKEGSDQSITLDELNSDLNDNTFDFISIEEQDRDSTRSQNIDEYQTLRNMGFSTDANVTDPYSDATSNVADYYNSVFGYNFVVPFLPVPLDDMHGQVLSGITTLSKYTIQNGQDGKDDYPVRCSLPNITTFPLNMFELKRCLTITRYNIAGSNHQFVYITAHFSAYDKSGEIRRKQLNEVNQIFTDEINKGNYVIMGADWNQTLPGCYGYEGSDVYGAAGPSEDPDDPAIAPWDNAKFNYNSHNAKNPDVYKDFEQYPEYDYQHKTTYKAGDTVWYRNENDPTPNRLDSLTYYMRDPKAHVYVALVDNPVEEPIIYDSTTGSYRKSDQWRYFINRDYRNVSLTRKVRRELLPITEQENGATIYTIHAMPTLRNAGFQYRNEATQAHLNGSDYTGGNIYKSNIDGFLVSNNIKVQYSFGFDTNYKYADHNPVGIIFQLLAN